ncbi:MAG: ComF family protein [Pseudomonadota bacterium]
MLTIFLNTMILRLLQRNQAVRERPNRWLATVCFGCGAERRSSVANLCGGCLEDVEASIRLEPVFGAGDFVPYPYQGTVAHLIRRAKFGPSLAAAWTLGELLANAITDDACTVDWVVPVPLHWRRELGRGFNQAAAIAIVVARRLNASFAPGRLTRPRATAPQSNLSPLERRRNVNGAFEWRGSQTPGSIVLIDDVVTTGATARSVKRCLRAAGVTDVRMWAVAAVDAGPLRTTQSKRSRADPLA